MKAIYKYPLEPKEVQQVQMPVSHEILSAADQDGTVCVWALVDTDTPMAPREFGIYGTGNPIPQDWPGEFIDTIHVRSLVGTALVFHIFDRGGK